MGSMESSGSVMGSYQERKALKMENEDDVC